MLFREMRRKKQALSEPEIEEVLHRGTSGVLALAGDNDYPYAVPISYVYDDGKLYFHSAKTGHKTDAIKRNEKASFCVTDQDQIVPKQYTTYFRSVIVFGKVKILEDERAKKAAIEKLAIKYAPEDSDVNRSEVIRNEWEAFCMLEMTIEHVTGKAARELVSNVL